MLVVADTFPFFIALLKISHVDILPKLYRLVVIPPTSCRRCCQPHETRTSDPDCQAPRLRFRIRTPSKLKSIGQRLDSENAAINLARELRADLLLIDETKDEKLLGQWHIPVVRTAAMILDAANAGVLPDLEAAFDN